MKKNQVNEIFYDQTKKRNKVIIHVFLIVLFTIFSFILLLNYLKLNKNYYINYVENTNIDYQVYLNKNEFFNENYLPENNRYVSSLVDYIDTKFKYDLALDDTNIDYEYSYKIEAEVNVVQKGSAESLYNFKETLLEKDVTKTSTNLSINENLKVYYNHYNNKVNKFIKTFNLDDVESVLKVNMYVDVVGNCDNTTKNKNNDSIASLVIPLSQKTMIIDVDYDLTTSDENVLVCKTATNAIYIYLVMSIIFAVMDLIVIYYLFKFLIANRSAETIYDKELKKILSNYSSYIQKANNEFDFSLYQVIKIETFTDMIEIRDTIRCPILMIENNEKNSTYFLIPHSNILYVYNLKVSEIKKQIINNTEEKL